MILERDPDNRTRHQRLSKTKRGPGVFVYEGGSYVVEHSPTVLLTRKREIATDDDGAPIVDGSGRLTYRPAGTPVLDHEGKVRMGGKPKEKRIELEERVIQGVVLPKGVPVRVDSPTVALKMRCLGIKELSEGDESVDVIEGDEPAPKKRGRPAKVKAETSVEE